ncbi:MAG: GNAT family N-acetyltransferase [Woeseiaceae bacterium]
MIVNASIEVTLEALGDFPSLVSAFEETHEANGVARPLLSDSFMVPLCDHLASDTTLLLVGRREKKVVMLLPIVRKRFGIYETFSPSQLPVTFLLARDLSVDRALIRQCAKAIQSPILMLSILDFDQDAFPTVQIDQRIAESRPYADTMRIAFEGQFETYWASRSKKLRDNIKRYCSRLEKAGHDLGFKVNKDPQDISTALAKYAAIEQAGWKGKQGTAIDLSDSQGVFYLDAFERFAKNGNVRILELLAGDQVVSSRIVVFLESSAVFLKTTYDEKLKKYSPGRILLQKTVEYLFGLEQLEQVEFYTKVTPDQAQWSTATRPVVHLELHRYSLTQFLRRLQFKLKNRKSAV